jgi:hypothetical protein
MIYESEEYLSHLVLDEEQNPRWRSRKPSSPLEKAVFLWNISMRHILDGLNHEYKKIAESETTDEEQLVRIRKLLEGESFLVVFSVARAFRHMLFIHALS